MRNTRSELAKLKYLRKVGPIVDFLGMTVADFAAFIPSQWSTRKHISPQLVCDWKRGRRKPNRTQIDRIAQLIANRLTARYGREIGISIKTNSPWRVQAWVWCVVCKKYHELKSARQKCKRVRQ